MNIGLPKGERLLGHRLFTQQSRYFPRWLEHTVAPGVVGLLALLTAGGPARADVPVNRRAVLAHGINITRWFSAPYVQSPAHYSGYLTPAVLSQLKSAGFSYVRIVLAPEAGGNRFTFVSRQIKAGHRLRRKASLYHDEQYPTVLYVPEGRSEDRRASFPSDLL